MKKILLRIITFLTLAICIVTPLSSLANDSHKTNQDPFEVYNRSAFVFNTEIDKAILTPLAKTYIYVLPSPVRTGIGNVFGNFQEMPSFFNDILQGNIYYAFSDLWRILINTTVGIGGIFDVASHIGLPVHYTDFGVTLGTWGYRHSYYFVLPFWGPSTVRDAVALPINYYLFTIYPHIHPTFTARWPVLGLLYVHKRADLLNYSNFMAAASFDPYIFQKNAYLQYMNKQITDAIEASPWGPEGIYEPPKALLPLRPFPY